MDRIEIEELPIDRFVEIWDNRQLAIHAIRLQLSEKVKKLALLILRWVDENLDELKREVALELNKRENGTHNT